MEFDVDQGSDGSRGEDKGNLTDNNNMSVMMDSAGIVTEPTAITTTIPGANYEALYNETKNRFLEYTLKIFLNTFILRAAHILKGCKTIVSI